MVLITVATLAMSCNVTFRNICFILLNIRTPPSTTIMMEVYNHASSRRSDQVKYMNVLTYRSLPISHPYNI